MINTPPTPLHSIPKGPNNPLSPRALAKKSQGNNAVQVREFRFNPTVNFKYHLFLHPFNQSFFLLSFQPANPGEMFNEYGWELLFELVVYCPLSFALLRKKSITLLAGPLLPA
jgi:hypothetical protein